MAVFYIILFIVIPLFFGFLWLLMQFLKKLLFPEFRVTIPNVEMPDDENSQLERAVYNSIVFSRETVSPRWASVPGCSLAQYAPSPSSKSIAFHKLGLSYAPDGTPTSETELQQYAARTRKYSNNFSVILK